MEPTEIIVKACTLKHPPTQWYQNTLYTENAYYVYVLLYVCDYVFVIIDDLVYNGTLLFHLPIIGLASIS